MALLPEALPQDKQDKLNRFLNNKEAVNKFYLGNTHSSRTLLTIYDSTGRLLLTVKHIPWLPTCESKLHKIFGWLRKTNYLIESLDTVCLAPGFLQMHNRPRGFGDITIFSESCEEILSIDQRGYSFDISILEKNFNGVYFLNLDNKISSIIFDENLDCQLCLQNDEDVEKHVDTKLTIYAKRDLSDTETMCLSLIALLPEISFRLMPGGGG